MKLSTFSVSRTESALVGSSSNSMSCLKCTARAIATACRCPPERSSTISSGEVIPAMRTYLSRISIAVSRICFM